MNNVTNEDLDALVKNVSVELQRSWANKHNDGKSIAQTVAFYTVALVDYVANTQKKLYAFATACVSGMLFFLCLLVLLIGVDVNKWILCFVMLLFLVSTVIGIEFHRRFGIRAKEAHLRAAKYITALNKFREAIASLNPLGSGQYLRKRIDKAVVEIDLRNLACLFLVVQDSFNQARKTSDDLHHVASLGDQFARSEAVFLDALESATKKFDLPFVKNEVLKLAREHLEELKKKPPEKT